MTAKPAAPGSVLLELVDKRSQSVKTRSLDLSLNELLDMYKGKELQIAPDYQRLFRWPYEKRSRFIESLILGMPVPPIYVVEDENGVYELIDGLQRLSTYFHFRGALPAEYVGEPPDRQEADDNQGEAQEEAPATIELPLAPSPIEVPQPGEGPLLELVDCDIVPELNGHTYETLPVALKIALKRASVRVEVIRRASDRRLRYHMFKRLNTGGETLSEQEIRNCTIRLLNDRFNTFIIERSQHPSFVKSITHLGRERKQRRYDQEYVLRFFAFKNWRTEYTHALGEFLTDYMERVSMQTDQALPFDYAAERLVFDKTFDVLVAALGDAPFAAVDAANRTYAKFSVLVFEAFAVGMQPHLERFDPNDATQMAALAEALKSLRQDPKFRKNTVGGGLNYARPLQRRLDIVADHLATVK